MSNGTTTWSYTYNADGLRTSRTNGTNTYTYTYNGDKLTYMTVNGYLHLYFAYDASGVPMSVTYNGTTYYYVTNVQGDVIGLLDENGNEVASYAYDAWGKQLSTDSTEPDNIGAINPLRYRSYVYDSETKFYYLQSRYYNPELGRFINIDFFVSTGQGIIGNNMFAYCNSNPANMYDPDGLCSKFLGFLWKVDCGKSTCKTSRKYASRVPSSFEKFLLHMTRPRKEGNTFSVGVSGGVNSGGITGGKSGVLSVDTSYNYAFQGTTSMGAAPGVGGSGGLVMTYTNATNVQDLAGASTSYGVTVVGGAGVSIDYITFTPSSNPNTTCWGISVVVSLGGELEVHAAENYTTSTKSWNPFLSLHNFLYGG